ncbi:MAG: AbrB/MazE/SpoVT family DNA-binding domain-containing protein [Candidatus Binatia bacterium]|nr:AbrB/MazE/SpoVT family DNA-binding domain-containing protein [Candidatus Binatia bacterium]
MAETVTLGHKGEVVLPRKVRGELGLKPGDELELRLEGDTIVLRKKAGHFAAYLERLGRRKQEPER